MKYTRVQLELDTNKRHLVVGDLHGRWITLQRLLEKVNYDPAKDIVYSVGDLIDRGLFSVEVLEFFQQDGKHAVLGNHEQMAEDVQWHPTWLANGGRQCLDSLSKHSKKIKWLQSQIRSLPLMIDVGDSGDPYAFRVIHADLPPRWTEADIDYAFDKQSPREIETMLWSRQTIKNYNAFKDIGKVVFPPCRTRTTILGHTPKDNPITIGNMHFIDNWNELTIMDALTKEKVRLRHVAEDYPKYESPYA